MEPRTATLYTKQLFLAQETYAGAYVEIEHSEL